MDMPHCKTKEEHIFYPVLSLPPGQRAHASLLSKVLRQRSVSSALEVIMAQAVAKAITNKERELRQQAE